MRWIRFERLAPAILRLAACHCLLWGAFVILDPDRSAVVYGLQGELTDVFLWQGTGLVIALLGVGYAIASFDPRRHYAVVLVGLLAKTLGPMGLLWSVWQGALPSDVLVLLPWNDLIWLLPFAWIVREGLRTNP